MKKTVTAAVLLAFLAGAVPALAQEGENTPVILDVRYFIFPQSLAYLFAYQFDPDSDVAQEWDLILVEIDVQDADLASEDGEDFFYLKRSYWVPYVPYFSPEPPPVDGDTMEQFRPLTNRRTLGPDSVTLRLSFFIPEWTGRNQAHLRGDINYDVRWVVQVLVWDEEDGDLEDDPIPWFQFQLLAEENPGLRPPNPPPFGDAGADQTVPVGSTVTLDGIRTFDAFNVGFDPLDPEVFEKDELEYTWEWITGPERVDPVYRDPARPYVAEVTLNTVGTYSYRLLVSDGVNAMPSSDSVVIAVVSLVAENNAPRAVIVPPTGTILVGSVIVLDGTSSFDPDGDALNYRWMQTDEVGGTIPPEDFRELFQPLSGLSSPISIWQAVRAGTYYFRLLVDDGELGGSATVSLEVVEPESAGIVVGPDGLAGGGQEPQPQGSDDLLAPLLPGPAACGGSLVPLAILPLLLWPMRGRIR